MAASVKLFFLLILFGLTVSKESAGQAWNFIKEKDGVKVYTRKEPGHQLKSFKGEADIHVPMSQVTNLIGNVKNVDWWDKNVKDINLLMYEKDKKSQYYLVYDSPWPVSDRDICSEANYSDDKVTGIRTIRTKPLPNVIPEKPGLVRIKDYWQKWTIEPMGESLVHVTLEGYVDPGGSVPDWIYNMVITETPLKVIRGVKRRLEGHEN